jgi:hypothetical protein
VRQRGVGHVHQALHVQVHHGVPLVHGCTLDRAQQHHAGVVDHGVQPAQLVDGALHGGLRLRAVGHVGLDGQRLPAGLLDLGGQGLEPVGAARGHGHGRSVGGQVARAGLADAAGGPGDQDHGSLEYVV